MSDVLPHDEQDAGTNETVLDGTRIEIRTGVVKHLAHDVGVMETRVGLVVGA